MKTRLTQPWRIGCMALLGGLFGLFAFFQLNDTDPAVYHQPSIIDAWSWVAFYGLISILCVVSIFRSVPKPLLVIAALFCVYEMVTTAPGLYRNFFEAEHFTMTGASMSPTHSEVELSREFFGALIGLAGVGVIWWQTKNSVRKSA